MSIATIISETPTKVVTFAKLLGEIPEQVSRSVGKGNRGGERRQQET